VKRIPAATSHFNIAVVVGVTFFRSPSCRTRERTALFARERKVTCHESKIREYSRLTVSSSVYFEALLLLFFFYNQDRKTKLKFYQES